jgi:hypothetical protein
MGTKSFWWKMTESNPELDFLPLTLAMITARTLLIRKSTLSLTMQLSLALTQYFRVPINNDTLSMGYATGSFSQWRIIFVSSHRFAIKRVMVSLIEKLLPDRHFADVTCSRKSVKRTRRNTRIY